MIRFFAKNALTDPTDVLPAKGAVVHDAYSKDVQALLARNLAIMVNCGLTDHDGVTMTVKNARSYVIWLYHVAVARAREA